VSWSTEKPLKSPWKCSRRGCNRRGQSLVEFAVVALVVYMLLAAILTFGQLLFSAQTLQQAADVAAREIGRTPLSATADMMDVLYSSDPNTYSSVAGSGTSSVRTALFNPALLQFDLTTVPPGETVLDVVRTWPVINQMLYPLMVLAGSDAQATYLVYPGAVPCSDSRSASRNVWCVAEVTGRQGNGGETITWVPVVEEMNTGAFSVATSGLVTVRINFGYQSASMSAYPPQQTWPPGPTGLPYGANDGNVTTSQGFYTPTAAPISSLDNTYSGQYGLGSQQAVGTTVRPYRSLISAQAIYRREVFQ
jgi:hypothetical protein